MDERTDRTSQTPPRASKCPRRLFRVASCFQTRREPSTERRRLGATVRDASPTSASRTSSPKRHRGGSTHNKFGCDLCFGKRFCTETLFPKKRRNPGESRHRTRTRTRRRRTARRESARRCGTSPPPPDPRRHRRDGVDMRWASQRRHSRAPVLENVTRRPLRGLRLVKRRARSGVRNASRIKQTQRAGARARVAATSPPRRAAETLTAHAGRGSRGKETLDKPDVGPKRDVGAAYAAKAASSSASAEILAEIDVRASPSSGNRDAPSSDPLPLPPTRAPWRVSARPRQSRAPPRRERRRRPPPPRASRARTPPAPPARRRGARGRRRVTRRWLPPRTASRRRRR